MVKVLKSGELEDIEVFKMSKFGEIDYKNGDYILETFDKDELSVQDLSKLGRFGRPPKESELLGLEKQPVYEKLFDDDGDDDDLFNFSDDITEEGSSETGRILKAGDNASDVEVHTPDLINTGTSTEHTGSSGVPAQQIQAGKPLEQSSKDELEELRRINADLLEEKIRAEAKLKELEESLPGMLSNARTEGYDSAVNELSAKEAARYEADKKDYINYVESTLSEVKGEVDKIRDLIKSVDEHLPRIVVSYVRQLIGKERAINDEFIVNIIKEALNDLKDVTKLVFYVNPEDKDTVEKHFPGYDLITDPTIKKGGVKINTKIGEVSLDVDSWMNNLEKQINEELANSKEH